MEKMKPLKKKLLAGVLAVAMVFQMGMPTVFAAAETIDSAVLSKTFNIVKSGTSFDCGVKTYKGEKQTDVFNYGDIITVKAKTL